MTSSSTFSIRLDAEDAALLNEFQRFLEKKGLNCNEVLSLVHEFSDFTIPQLSRIRTLSNSGSTVSFNRSCDTSMGKINLELNTAPKSVFARIASVFVGSGK